MKINKILFAFFLILISVSNVMATPGEPCPNGNCDQQIPGSPIDQNVVYLLFAALVLGVVMIYNDKIKKASA